MKETLWHTFSPTQSLKALKTSEKGLSAKEAKKRLKTFGPNRLPEEKPASVALIVLNQFRSPLVYVLVFAATLTFFLSDYTDTAIIAAAVFINAALGFYQEYKANRALLFLRKIVDRKARAMRDGNLVMISADMLVPGDIIVLEAGDRTPADCRVVSHDSLEIVEAALTGESMPVEKTTKAVAAGAPLADRKNMVYSGTIVGKGKAKAVVVATGIKTELGTITQLVKEAPEEQTPLQQQLAQFSRYLTYSVLFAAVILVVVGTLQGRPLIGHGDEVKHGMLSTAVAIAVAAIPEGLLISVTAVLAIGMQAILRRKALVRKLVAAETLGSVSIICTDKTGTLTEGRMQVYQLVTVSDTFSKDTPSYSQSTKLKDHDLLWKIAVLSSDATIENPYDDLQKWRTIGDPTETALLMGAISAGLPYLEIQKLQPRLAEIPFDSDIKYMATLNKLNASNNVVYVKGAPEKILDMCGEYRVGGEKSKFTAEKTKELRQKYENMSKQGLRVLAFAYKKTNYSKRDLTEALHNLIFVGFIALKDPLRPETKETIQLARQAGVRSVIVTGDHQLTAKAIVTELGIAVTEKNILKGTDLDKMSDEKLDSLIDQIVIFARVEPKHKLRIIDAWQRKGEVVAMTGDGVNDAPALKKADIGIALGSGTDVAKETSDIVLLDDNFKTIIAAVERGRTIFDNIRKIILYLLVDSFSELVLIAGALVMALPLPLLPAQIIWINLITDGFPNLALTMEKGERDVMKEKPRPKKTKILDKEMKLMIFVIGVITDLFLLTLFYFLLRHTGSSIEYVRTIIFSALAIDSLLYVFSCRTMRHSVFTQNPFSNKMLIAAVMIGFALQFVALYVPLMQKVLDVVPLSLYDWLLVISLAFIKIIGIEVVKHFFIVKQRKVISHA